MTATRPTLPQVFPDPLTQQWPSTSNPVFCECQQLYALVSLCCSVAGTHLLVLHEGQSTNMLTAMPQGPKYVDFKITRRTSADDLASFLARANKAASVVAGGRWDTARHAHGADLVVSESAFSPRSGASPGSSLLQSSLHAPVPKSRKVVVVCLRGLDEASAEVLGMLMDALVFGCVAQSRGARRRSGPSPQRSSDASMAAALPGAGSSQLPESSQGPSTPTAVRRRPEHTVMIPCVRIIAFCDAQSYAVVLPESLRAAFDLSLFMSRIAMESAAVLQSGDPNRSNVVNRANLLELANSVDGDSLADTVTCSVFVVRYLRHLLLVLRGSTFNMDSIATYSLRKLNRFVHLLRAATVLFEPDDNAQLAARGRWALRLRQPAHTRLLSGGAGGSGRGEANHDDDDDEFTRSEDDDDSVSDGDPTQSRNAGAPRGKRPPTSYAHLVVTSSTVLCLFSSLLSHLPAVSRYTPPPPDVIDAARPLLKSLSATPSALGTSFMPARVSPSLYAPGLWDARMATQSAILLRNGTSYAMVARALDTIGAARGGGNGAVPGTGPAGWQDVGGAQPEPEGQPLGASRLLGSLSGTINFGTHANAAFDDPALCLGRLMCSPGALAVTGRLVQRGVGLGGTAAVEAQLHATGRRATPPTGALGATYSGTPAGASLGDSGNGNEAHSGRALDAVDLLDYNSDPSYLDVLQYNEVRELIRAVIIARSAPAPG